MAAEVPTEDQSGTTDWDILSDEVADVVDIEETGPNHLVTRREKDGSIVSYLSEPKDQESHRQTKIGDLQEPYH